MRRSSLLSRPWAHRGGAAVSCCRLDPWAAHEFSMITLAHHTRQTERGALRIQEVRPACGCRWTGMDPGEGGEETEPGWGASESERK